MTAIDYDEVDRLVREKCGNDYDYFIPREVAFGNLIVDVLMKPRVDRIVFTIEGGVPPRSYPDAITNPLDPPTVDGTTIERPI